MRTNHDELNTNALADIAIAATIPETKRTAEALPMNSVTTLARLLVAAIRRLISLTRYGISPSETMLTKSAYNPITRVNLPTSSTDRMRARNTHTRTLFAMLMMPDQVIHKKSFPGGLYSALAEEARFVGSELISSK
jgi:hypothetical protein